MTKVNPLCSISLTALADYGMAYTFAVEASVEDRRRRMAAAALPLLVHRCKSVLTGYLASASLRGSYPFERVREEELAYIIRRLLELELWSGSFRAMEVGGKSRA